MSELDAQAQAGGARDEPRLRVRTGTKYTYAFVIDLGQENAVFVKRALTPLRRFFHWGDALTFVPEPGYDLVHSHNAVPLLTFGRPYVITFETYLPRLPEDRPVPWLEAVLRRRLLAENCVALIAKSEYGRRQFLWQNRGFDRLPELVTKLRVLYPGIETRPPAAREPSSVLRLLFVGNDFMRKGGPAVLRAHRALSRLLPVETTIVSRLRWSPDDYVGPSESSYVEGELELLAQDGVVLHRGLPNGEVLRLMQRADFVLFPTLHDTFGYASLEALSCGTPVIATRTCAQPEIVEDGVCGYLLPLENDDEVGKWTGLRRRREPEYLDAYDEAIRRLSEGIADVLLRAFEDRADWERLREGAQARVRERFDRGTIRSELEELYERAASGRHGGRTNPQSARSAAFRREP